MYLVPHFIIIIDDDVALIPPVSGYAAVYDDAGVDVLHSVACVYAAVWFPDRTYLGMT